MAALLALLSSALWGSADFGGGLLSRRLPPVAVVGWSQSVALVAVTVAVVATGTWSDPAAWLGWAVAAGLCGAGGLMCFYRALSVGTMGVVAPIAALGVLVPVLAGLLTGERPSPLQLLGMAAAVLGAVAAGGPELSGAARASSVLLAVASGVLFGLTTLCLARGARGDALLVLLGMRGSQVVAFVLIAATVRSLGGVTRGDLPALAAVGLTDVGANLLFALASTRGLVSVVAVLGSLYPVATVLLAYLVLKERVRPIQTAGVVSALAGVVLVSAG